jgi:hypothetical protein
METVDEVRAMKLTGNEITYTKILLSQCQYIPEIIRFNRYFSIAL